MGLISHKYHGLGTNIRLTLPEYAEESDFDAADNLINQFEDRLTVNRRHSEVMSINQQAGIMPVKVSKVTYELIKKAVEVSNWNLGFNVAIGPLVKLWHIGFNDAHKPTNKKIQQKLKLIDPKNIQLNDKENSVFLAKKGMEIDLGGIAKGFIADEVKRLWQQRNLKSGIVDLGGNVLLMGPSIHKDKMWKVGIQNPQAKRNIPIGAIHTTAKSIGTSGIYERNLNVSGQMYHHMFNSLTGYPIDNNLASVTIVSDHSIDGEIWSTIGFYQGINTGKSLIELQPGIEAIFVTKDLDVLTTNGLKDNFQLFL